eukprot:TRINITY_DN1330_c0_g1_i4.p1 TRINITY_DN1330_c0_g1~~TRINITY_DN1330_c0_g1_i4.p1  ORF type:complete len:280 (+),score=59.30 TRINITY_DN1330_c0_g1_i4:74-913(+)
MTITGCLILPHGAITLRAPQNLDMLESCQRLHSACHTACKSVLSEGVPDIVVLITPHGISNSRDFGVYLNDVAEGDAEWDNDWKEYKAKCNISVEISNELLKLLTSNFMKADGITAFAEICAMPLRWGEVIPLWFLHQNLPNHENVKHVILSVPRRRIEVGAEMIPELEELGSKLEEFFQPREEKVLIVISGDLAHKHSHSIPHHPAPYGVHDQSEHFDALCEKWAKDSQDRDSLFDAAKMLNDVRSCGFTGFVILGEILNRLRKRRKQWYQRRVREPI